MMKRLKWLTVLFAFLLIDILGIHELSASQSPEVTRPVSLSWSANGVLAIGYMESALFARGYVKIVNSQLEELSTLSPQAFRSLAWRPNINQNHLAITGFIGIAYVVDTSTGEVLHKFQPPDYANGIQVVWSPDGKYLGFLCKGNATIQGNVSVWDVDEGKLVYYESTFLNTTLGWQPDSKHLAIGRSLNPSYQSSDRIDLINVETGQQIASLAMSEENTPRSIVSDATAANIYVLGDKGLEVWDSKTYQRILLDQAIRGNKLIWLGGEKRLLISNGFRIFIFDVENKQLQEIVEDQRNFFIEDVAVNLNTDEIGYIKLDQTQPPAETDLQQAIVILSLENR